MEREVNSIVDWIHHALVLVKSPTTHPIVNSSSVPTYSPTSYIFSIYQQTTVACFVYPWLILLRRYNIGSLNSKRKSIIISDSSNCQSYISYFTFRSNITPHLVDSYTQISFFLSNFLCASIKKLLVLTLRPFRSALCDISQLFLPHLSLQIHSILPSETFWMIS